MNNYLIPANVKRGKLIFGIFREIDLMIFSIGAVISFILLVALPLDNLTFALIGLAPGLICSFLVLPLPYYHNVMTFIIELYNFLTDRQKFIWKGWCFLDESSKEK